MKLIRDPKKLACYAVGDVSPSWFVGYRTFHALRGSRTECPKGGEVLSIPCTHRIIYTASVGNTVLVGFLNSLCGK